MPAEKLIHFREDLSNEELRIEAQASLHRSSQRTVDDLAVLLRTKMQAQVDFYRLEYIPCRPQGPFVPRSDMYAIFLPACSDFQAIYLHLNARRTIAWIDPFFLFRSADDRFYGIAVKMVLLIPDGAYVHPDLQAQQEEIRARIDHEMQILREKFECE